MNYIAPPPEPSGDASVRKETTQAQSWREQNREAVASSNAYVEKFGLPLARFRRF
jgi:post-segregation antitoxin (ccd killing protein)